MTSSLILRLSVTLASLGIVSMGSLFGADSTDLLSKALDLVHQVENPTGPPLTDAQRIDLLAQAIQLAKEAPNHRLKGHRVLAIQDIRTALTAIQQGDPHQKANDYLHQADNELSAAISLAGEAAPSSSGPNVAPPPPPPASAASIPPSASQTPAATPETSAPAPDALAPGVTPEMEQAFLAKYKAALKKKDPDALFALVALDPKMDPKAKEDLKGILTLGFLIDLSNLNRTYSFVPLSSLPPAKDEATQLNGKMYDAYLPAVIALKVAFGQPARPPSEAEPVATGNTTTPLCIQNHQLMMVGLKEIPGAVPPPAVDKAANFGIEPNLLKGSDKIAWEKADGFTSLKEFLPVLKQPALQILASGESKYEYYAICRIAPNLCVWAGGDKTGEANYSFSFTATDSNQQKLKGAPKWIRLVDTPTDNGQAPNVQGTVFFVPDHYSGPITLEADYGDNDSGKTTSLSRTIDWK